jgi:hypothetical protein
MAQCLVTFAVISPIEPSLPITVDGIMDPGLPPHTPYLGTPVVFPPGQRPVSFYFGEILPQIQHKYGKANITLSRNALCARQSSDPARGQIWQKWHADWSRAGSVPWPLLTLRRA